MKIWAQENLASIIYLDAHHSVCNVWQDTMVNENPAKAKNDHLSLGLRQPSGKGQRLIITYAGGNFGFVKNSLWTYRASKRKADYQEMDAEHFEKWFMEKLAPNIPD